MKAFRGRGMWLGDLLRDIPREGGMGILASSADDGKAGGWSYISGRLFTPTAGDGEDWVEEDGEVEVDEVGYMMGESSDGHWYSCGTNGVSKTAGETKSCKSAAWMSASSPSWMVLGM